MQTASHSPDVKFTGKSAVPSRIHVNLGEDTPDVYSFFEKVTSTWTYVVADPVSKEAAVIDPVLDYDHSSGKISTETADGILAFIHKECLTLRYILETHAHADHLTAAQHYKQSFGCAVPVCIGSRIKQVQQTFAPIYDVEPSLLDNAFDIYFRDDERFKLGDMLCKILHLPGHTPDHLGYVFGRVVFTGDSIFMPDVGSARADFPGGNVKDLYNSMQRLLSLPFDYLLFVGHDYPPERAIEDVVTVEEQRRRNKHVKAGTDEAAFTAFRSARDAQLGAPKLLHPSLQVNIRAGKLPPADAEGRVFFKVPVKTAVAL
ncbi:Metallo-hydrolase/oxidoreductase [Neolentinus lepideus HHB14362 ss-1]|uniref:Metallo-hydrolase/oxidoreductase n=1 Tax=Neolentinus lepideus HHB14362 ss-1 TaxID=1314782 RepID=A0A165TLB3_9AGAM|nr:Metallo-hydrolase/oxidoreductase [Neolentinus lepideus HHB14362 ss-1]